MKLTIQKFDKNIIVNNCDIICIEKIERIEFIKACSIVEIRIFDKQLKVKFEWKERFEYLDELNFIPVPETEMVFFRTANQWGAIDTANKLLKRHEEALCFPYIEHKKNFVLIEDELYAESCRLNGDRIDNVPIDPPWEFREYVDRIEYESLVYGHQILKIK